MNQIEARIIDNAIDRITTKLASVSNIKELYPNQRKMLHNFCAGKNIIYTGKVPAFIYEKNVETGQG